MKFGTAKSGVLFCLLVLAGTGICGGQSGGGPPPLQQDMQLMMASAQPGFGVLTDTDQGLYLVVDRKLETEMIVSTNKNGAAIQLTEPELRKAFPIDAGPREHIDLVNLEGDHKSYLIEAGDSSGELVLKDRLDLIRAPAGGK